MAKQYPSETVVGKQHGHLTEHLVDQRPLLAAWPAVLASWKVTARHVSVDLLVTSSASVMHQNETEQVQA